MKSEHQLQELENVFRQYFRKVATEWGKRLDGGITGPQSFILEVLELKGPQRVSDLAEELGITLPAVTGLSDKLIAAGYAERERSQEDRRIVFLKITDKGSDAVESLREQRRRIMRKIYWGLSEEDIGHLIRIYKSILQNMESREME